MRLILPFFAACLLAACTPAATQPPATEAALAEAPAPAPAVLASFDAPAFLENLIAEPDGSAVFTNYTGKSLHRIAADGTLSLVAGLDVHPVSLVRLGDTYLLAAHAIPFTVGPEFIGSGQLLTLSAAGEVLSKLAVPQAGFLNGMVVAADGKVLIADSVNAQILVYDPVSSALETWFADALLAPQTDPFFLPGANGLKFEGGDLLVSSSATRSIYRLGVSANGAAEGPLEPVVADLPGTDDFLVLPEGGYVATTHANLVVSISPEGEVKTVTDDARLKGNTAVALRGSGETRTLLVLGTGGLSEDLAELGVVMELPFPG